MKSESGSSIESIQPKNDEYMRVFMEFDLDGSGGVNKSEMVKVLKAYEINID